MEKKVYIYSLNGPNGDIRYIGKTINPKRRLSSHIQEAKSKPGERHVLNWILSLITKGEKPTLSIVEVCTDQTWQEREIYWIQHYKDKGCKLCNICRGGLGGTCNKNYSKEELKKRGETMSRTMSKFPKKTKDLIWKMLLNGDTLEDIQKVYPEFSRHMEFGVKNGRQWNSVTGLHKTKGATKRKGYTLINGIYYVRETLPDKKRMILFSSKVEQEVINYLHLNKQCIEMV